MLRMLLCTFLIALSVVFGNATAQQRPTGFEVVHAVDQEITIQLKWKHQFQFAGYYAALEQGYFADEGLNVVLRERDTSENIIQQVLDGRSDYAITDSVALLEAGQNPDIVLVAAIFQYSANAIVSLREKQIRRPRDLAGRRIGFYESSADGLDVLALLADQRIRDVELVPGSWQERLSMLRNHEIDATVVYLSNEPIVLREDGLDIHVMIPRHFGIDLYGDILFTSRTEAELFPERAAAVRRAVIRGWEYALAHPQELVELIYSQYNTQNKSRSALFAEAQVIASLVSATSTPVGELDPGRIEFLSQQLQRLNLLQHVHAGQSAVIFNEQFGRSVQLTEAEKTFLAELGSIRVGVEALGWPPFEMLDEFGQLSGLAAEYLDIIAETLGLQFELVPMQSWDDMLQATMERRIDLLPVIAATPERSHYLNFTAPYVRSPMVIVTREDVDFIPDMQVLRGQRVGVVGGYASDELLSEYYPYLQLVRYPNTEAGLHALASGLVDVFVDNLAVASFLIRRDGLANLKISGQTPYSFDSGVAVRNDWPLLHSAIGKVLASIPAEQHQEIYARWVQLEFSQRLSLRAMWLPLSLIAIVVISLLAYLARLRLLNNRLRRAHEQLSAAQDELAIKNLELQKLSVTDKLTGVFNRYFLDLKLAEAFEHASRYQRNMSIVLIDLDYFKRINDELGHQVGDRVLQEFADLVERHIRRSDIFGRWGGEEFLLICPETDDQQALAIADKIRFAVVNHRFSQSYGVTISAGVKDNQNVDSIDQLITAADRALYQAKASGRNQACIGAAKD
ncbi:MAG: diguanylate cyclase [Aliidiomarina sp.]|uniref:diguanylate cyclase n=1 Tax=Aliidiomarina sp. TaxID=1872439 RepID=UPI0025BE93BF|nr:transporter substrate-binding domain-containing protein [Aliidiomarina sp.]MCH8501117.1 diguanylate cyclase [Aliidiomarina sp.]